MDVPPCQLRLEEFLLRRLFGPLSLHLQEISGSPPSGDVNSYRKWHSRSEFSHDKMVIFHSLVGAARLAQVCHLFQLGYWWKVCGLNVFKLQKTGENGGF